MKTLKKPLGMSGEHLEYLDDLSESGVTNMYGAGAYLSDEFGIDKKTSHEWLGYWMETFSDRHKGK